MRKIIFVAFLVLFSCSGNKEQAFETAEDVNSEKQENYTKESRIYSSEPCSHYVLTLDTAGFKSCCEKKNACWTWDFENNIYVMSTTFVIIDEETLKARQREAKYSILNVADWFNEFE